VKGKALKLIKGEKGQALLIVLLVMLFGSLILPPMLSYMSSGLKTGKEVFEEGMYLSYAADSGVEDALWQVKEKQLPNLFTNYEKYGYYDYSPSYEWDYYLDDEYGDTGIVNDSVVNVAFQNVWMPKGISAPSASEAESIANEGRLVVYGTMSGTSATEYQIKLIYYYNNQSPSQPDYDPEGKLLMIQKIGIWLPPGFEYNDSLAGVPVTPSLEYVSYKGGKAVVWTFSTPQMLYSFPQGTSSINPIVRNITFQFTGPEGRSPGTALSWATSTGVSGISYSWDSSVKVYKITSEATGESGKVAAVEAYATTTDMLKRGAAICGDYCALGGTLMTETTDVAYRDRLFKESSATVQSTNPEASFYIPPSAHVDLAYLYWTGWLQNTAMIWGDDCSDFNDWSQSGSNWRLSSESFQGHYYGSGSRELTMNKDLDLSSYAGQAVKVSWAQDEEGRLEGSGEYIDGLDYAFSKDGGVNWSGNFTAFRDDDPPATKTVTIPSQYITSQFRMRFILIGCSESGEYVYVDNISISVTYTSGSLVADARANNIRFNGTILTAAPTDIQTRLTGGTSLSYRCKYDVSALVTGDGSGTYTVGHVLDWPGSYQMYNYPSGTSDGTTAYPLGTPAYKVYQNGHWVWADTQLSHAAWSLVIVYSSPETQGHQLYLYDDFAYAVDRVNLDFDGDGNGGGTVGGFIAPDAIKDEAHAARLTCFVGEGDDWIGGDDPYYGPEYIRVNGTLLWDGTYSVAIPGSNTPTAPYNVWNGMSKELTASGIDIDNFTVAYPTIRPGDILAQVDMRTGTDNWDLVYIILSFRSDIVPASTVSYLLR
jgi:hypothetical protein